MDNEQAHTIQVKEVDFDAAFTIRLARGGTYVDLVTFCKSGEVKIGDAPDAAKEAMKILATHWREQMQTIDADAVVRALSRLDDEAFATVMERVRELPRCLSCGKRKTGCWCDRDSRPDD